MREQLEKSRHRKRDRFKVTFALVTSIAVFVVFHLTFTEDILKDKQTLICNIRLYTVGTNFKPHNLMSIDVRFRRLKSIAELKKLKTYNGRTPITTFK